MADQVVDYAEIRDTLNTGDIVLFQGIGWESDVVKALAVSPWTHVATIVRESHVDFPMIWESTPLKFIEDVIISQKKSGARLVSLDDRLANALREKFYGRFAIWRREAERTPEMIHSVKDFIAGAVHYLPFPSR